jgi:hypothetical protein
MNFINSINDLLKLATKSHSQYINADPFPYIIFKDFFDESFLDGVLAEFPDLSREKKVFKHHNHNEEKFGGIGEDTFGPQTKSLMHYLNSQPFLEFLSNLTGLRETLIPDPYFIGGGCHEIKPGGFLKVHADFNKHELTKLDRRINVLVYLNKDWDESYGGHFELWNKDVSKAMDKILPLFNTVVVFSTTSFSYHGHPNPLTCPTERSRKSLALYYYSNGRPASEINSEAVTHSTLFVGRKDMHNDVVKIAPKFKTRLLEFIPPILIKILKKL